MLTPEIMTEILKIGGVPAFSIAVVIYVWIKQGPDRKVSNEDALAVEVSQLRASIQDHAVRLAVVETMLSEREKLRG